MSWTVTVENIKCGGCANSIRKAVGAVTGVTGVEVDVEKGDIRVEGEEAARAAVARRLLELGYPESGAVSGLGSVAAKAKSFVSCAIGRVS
ncbi:MAG: heavy metal transporter [Betaproteobacteria bacterium RIFCSPLOWO2_02_FULL_62_17]|nr:MAG: heavy metal transporter [Betaproteobacteria bacterium RIFCSPLOWO2_02_FULL_62_17]